MCCCVVFFLLIFIHYILNSVLVDCGILYTMTCRKTRFCFQMRGDSLSSYHCCVPRCTASARCNSALSFFLFPKEEQLRKEWMVNIRRENFVITPQTKVCSRHFVASDIREPLKPQGRRRLLRGAVPVLFDWNHFSLPSPRPGPGPWEQRPRPHSPEVNLEEERADVRPDHDYCSSTGALDLTLRKIEELQSKNLSLRSQMENMVINYRFGLERFSASDDDIRFYTRFASYDHLKSFWNQIEPATRDIVTRAQPVNPAAPTSLQLIDEFFLFMSYLSLGTMEKELAHRFRIPQSSVSRIIITWANFLYTVLGAIGIWLSEETVQENLPEAFYEYPDTQVILKCTRLRCRTPESPLLQVFSSCKSYSTFKGLVGVAPHGAVTFVSPLFEGSIGDREILKRSGLIPLLKPTMALMVDQSFLAELEVPCKVHAPASLKKASSTAALRVHVERVLCRVKEHKLFQTEIPMSLGGCINQLFAVACVLVNFQNGPLYKT